MTRRSGSASKNTTRPAPTSSPACAGWPRSSNFQRRPGAAVPDLAQVTKVLAERAEHYDRTASFPADSIAAVHDAGLLTATVHERYGGQGARLAETAVILRALGQGDPSVALITAM